MYPNITHIDILKLNGINNKGQLFSLFYYFFMRRKKKHLKLIMFSINVPLEQRLIGLTRQLLGQLWLTPSLHIKNIDQMHSNNLTFILYFGWFQEITRILSPNYTSKVCHPSHVHSTKLLSTGYRLSTMLVAKSNTVPLLSEVLFNVGYTYQSNMYNKPKVIMS